MNLDEAYRTLELDRSASPEEIKKQFRKLAAKYHPDVNKTPGAEEKFKEINAAHEFITNYKEPPIQDHFNHNDFFSWIHNVGNFSSVPTKMKNSPPIQIQVKLTLEQAVYGTKYNIKINRDGQCQSCRGNGYHLTDEVCQTCNGKKVQTRKMGNTIIQSSCQSCFSTGKKSKECSDCKGYGVNDEFKCFDINLPPGLQDEQVVRLSGAGHFIPNHGYTEVFLRIQIQPEENMTYDGLNITSTLPITLVEALEGAEKLVKTLKGNVIVKVNPNSKNKDVIELIGHEFPRNGKHIFILDVQYPENVKELIEFLKAK